MVDMSETATYTPGRHRPFDLSDIEWANDLPPKAIRKTVLFEGQLQAFADHVRASRRAQWARYPFTYKSEGGAKAACSNARKTQDSGLLWEARGTSLFALAVTR